MKRQGTILLGLLLLGLFFTGTSARAQARRTVQATRVGTSRALRNMPSKRPQYRAPYAIPNRPFKLGGGANNADRPGFVDPVVQAQRGSMAATVSQNFDGTSDDDNAAILGFRIVPPDTEGDVGPNHYVQWNNLVVEIFDKAGNSILGPFPGNQFFQGLGGDCETTNDGDPVVRYDPLADRWVVSQFAVSNPHFICMAVSTGPDPTGTYYQYEFPFGSDFPDYFKVGVWSDAYYMTTRNFANGQSFTGVQAVAVERSQMLNGQAAQMVVIDIPGGTANDGWLPADLDGPAPPIGAPGIFAGAPNTTGSNQIVLYAMNVDWANTANSSLTQIATLPTQPFDTSINTVPQKKPGENLDALSGFLMFPMQYRNFGGHQTLMLNHTVDAGGNRAGIRWYELRDTGSGWSIYQQGTYAPNDGLSRWLGSIAMNGNGDIALGYTVSSKNSFPSIRFTGQAVAQSGSGIMDVAETTIVSGGGTQRQSSNRWGDYSATSVDPSDDLTFWHTNEYYAASGSFDFNTRIASFQIGGGGGTPPAAPSSLTATATSSSQINTGWTDNSTDEDSFEVERSLDNSTFALVATVGANSTSYTDSGLSASTTYYYRVRACNVVGCSSLSNTANATTQGGGAATDVHVENIVTGQQGVGHGNKSGNATVTIHDNLGGLGVGYVVSGTFSGDFNETASGTTDGNGQVVLLTAGSKKGKVNVGFCVDTVTGALPYNPSGNVSTSFDCSTANPARNHFSQGSSQQSSADSLPVQFALDQNFPNPFRLTTQVAYSLPEASRVRVRVFNVLGQEVASLRDGFEEAGRHVVAFDATDLSAGIYIYVMEAGRFTATRRMTVLK